MWQTAGAARKPSGAGTGLLVAAAGWWQQGEAGTALSPAIPRQRTSPGTSRVSKGSLGPRSRVGTARVLAAPSFRLIHQLLPCPDAFLIFGSCQKLLLFSRRWSKINFQLCSAPLHRLFAPCLGPLGSATQQCPCVSGFTYKIYISPPFHSSPTLISRN